MNPVLGWISVIAVCVVGLFAAFNADAWIHQAWTWPGWCRRLGHSWRHLSDRTLVCKRRCPAHYFLDLDRLYDPEKR
jgi:hypothetical protein